MKKLYATLIILFVIVGVGLGFYFGAQEFAVTSTDGKYYEVPTFGYLQCQEADFQLNYPSIDKISFGSTAVTCQQAGTLTQDCSVNVQLPTSKEADKLNAYLLYQIVEQGQPIPDGSRASVYWVKKAGFAGTDAGQLKTITLGSDKVLYMRYIEENLFNAIFNTGNTVNGKTEYDIRYRPFYIYKYDTFSIANGARLQSTDDCTFDGEFTRANPIVEFISSGELSNDYSSFAIGADSLREPERRVAFVSNFVTVPAGQFTFLNDNEYCYDKNIYQITEVQTTAGTYNVADVGVNTALRTVECCNDADAIAEKGPNFYCDENLEIQEYDSTTELSCSVFNPCPMTGYVPGVDGKVYFQDCIDGQCVTDSIEVECISNSDCSSGYCDYNAADPSESVCKSYKEIEYCGNGACEASRGEDINSCPKDCDPNLPPEGLPDWALYSILGVALLSVFAALGSSGKKKESIGKL